VSSSPFLFCGDVCVCVMRREEGKRDRRDRDNMAARRFFSLSLPSTSTPLRLPLYVYLSTSTPSLPPSPLSSFYKHTFKSYFFFRPANDGLPANKSRSKPTVPASKAAASVEEILGVTFLARL